MSGICGICKVGGGPLPTDVGGMVAALTMPNESGHQVHVDCSAIFGVAQRWPFQQVGTTNGVVVAVDADLVNFEETAAASGAPHRSNDPAVLSEVIAHLYLKDGPSFVDRLHGAFAVAVWDTRTSQLVLAIDPLGMKSMYWSHEGDHLLFATRARGVTSVMHNPSEVNTAAVMQFLLFSVVPAPMTIYRGLEKMRPGHRLIYRGNRVRHECYWDLSYDESERRDENHWANEVREGIRTAVLNHCEGLSSETSGAYLSGGTDSSSVTAFMSEVMSPVQTFSIAFSESRYNEIHFARTTAERFHTRHHERCLTPSDAISAITKITSYYDEPFANSSAIGSYFCAKLAADNGVETLLAGDGGDELFSGNSRYAEDLRFQMYHRAPAWIRRGLIEPIVSLLPLSESKWSLPRRYIRRANIPNPQRIFSYGLFQSFPPEEVFTNDFLTEVPPRSWMELAGAHFHGVHASSELNRLMHLDLKMILADNDLRKVSGTAELAGVNVRYPLLDDRLVRLSARIPSVLKMKGFKKRYIFKKAMKDILPKAVLCKKKHGFGVPLAIWLLRDGSLHTLMEEVLGDPQTLQRGYLRPEFLDRLRSLHKGEHAAYYGEAIWYFVALELWHRRLKERRPETAGVR